MSKDTKISLVSLAVLVILAVAVGAWVWSASQKMKAVEEPTKFGAANGYMTGATYGTYYAGAYPVLSAGQGAGLQMDQNGDVYVSVTGTFALNVAPGGNITVGGANPLKTIVLSSAGGWPTLTNGATTATKFEMTTNRENYQLAGYQPGVQNCEDWTAPMPDSYDGGTMSAKFYWTSTSTATFNPVSWTIKGTAVTTTGSLDAAWGATSTVTMLDAGGPNVLNVTSNTTMTVGGTPNGTKLLQFEVCRAKGSPDTATTTANLLSVELKYGVSTFSD